MSEQALLPFEVDAPSVPDPVDLEVSFDATFATASRIQLDETSWVDHIPQWLAGAQTLMRRLLTEADWEQRSRWMYTRMVIEPRMTAEYPVLAEAPESIIHDLADALSVHYDRPFSRLWMNWYRDNNDATGWHADRPAKKLTEAIIPVLSLGATRRFRLRAATGGPSTTIVVNDGDLVVMGGRCQNDYRHCVPRQKRSAGARVSLNFSADRRVP